MERSISSIGGIFLFYKFIQNIFTIFRPPLCGGGNPPFDLRNPPGQDGILPPKKGKRPPQKAGKKTFCRQSPDDIGERSTV